VSAGRPFGYRRPPFWAERMRAALAHFGEVLIRAEDGRDRSADLDARAAEAVALLDEVWRAGRRVGLIERVPSYVFVDVELAWRVIRRNDAIVGDDDLIYTVVRSGSNGPGLWGLTLASGTYREQFEDHPDTMARVILRAGLVDAVRLTREALEARMITTRANPDGTTDGDLLWRMEGRS
jgi:hypothetical protein